MKCEGVSSRCGRVKVWKCGCRIACAVMLLGIFAVAADAGIALKLTVPWDRDYVYWSTCVGIPLQIAPTQLPPGRFKGKKTTLDLPEMCKLGVKLTVYDPSTGNEAIELLRPDAIAKGLTLQKRDFDEVRRVHLKITSDHGKPVESALVTMSDVTGHKEIVRVDPTTAGVAEFLDVTAGEATVYVMYGDGKKASQQITIPEERDELIFTTEVPVAGPVATIKETKTEAAGGTTAKREKARKSGAEWAAALIGTIVGFVVLIGIVVVTFLYLRSKGVTVEDGLKKMGVELPEGAPEAQPAAPAPQVDPNQCPFCGQQKDAQGQCACTIAPTAAVGVSTGPRLVGSQGSYAMNVFELTADVVTIGRGEDNAISLSSDSTVSRNHARIVLENGERVIYDLGSSNGVFVNGEKVTQRALRPGDEVQIGTTRFRFEV